MQGFGAPPFEICDSNTAAESLDEDHGAARIRRAVATSLLAFALIVGSFCFRVRPARGRGVRAACGIRVARCPFPARSKITIARYTTRDVMHRCHCSRRGRMDRSQTLAIFVRPSLCVARATGVAPSSRTLSLQAPLRLGQHALLTVSTTQPRISLVPSSCSARRCASVRLRRRPETRQSSACVSSGSECTSPAALRACAAIEARGAKADARGATQDPRQRDHPSTYTHSLLHELNLRHRASRWRALTAVAHSLRLRRL